LSDDWKHDPLWDVGEDSNEPDILEAQAQDLQLWRVFEEEVDWCHGWPGLRAIRQHCLVIAVGQYFYLFCTGVVVSNIIVVGFRADDVLTNRQSVLLERIFHGLYFMELFIRSLGTPGIPWHSAALWFDLTLLVISFLDLYFLSASWIHGPFFGVYASDDAPGAVADDEVSLDNGGCACIVACMRFVRVLVCDFRGRGGQRGSDLGSGYESCVLAGLFRPQNLLRRAFRIAPALPVGLLFAGILLLYIASIAMRSIEQQANSAVVSGMFSDVPTTALFFAELMGAGGNYKLRAFTIDPLRDRSAALGLVSVIYYVLVTVLINMTLSIMVEHLLHVGRQIDLRAALRQEQASIDLSTLKQALHRMDLRGDGEISEAAIKVCMTRQPDIKDMLGMSMEEAVALFKEVDFNSSGKVSMKVFLLAIVRTKCVRKDIDTLVIEQAVNTAQDDVQNAMCSFDKLQFGSLAQQRYDELLVDVLERQAVFFARIWDIGGNISTLDAHLDVLRKTVDASKGCVSKVCRDGNSETKSSTLAAAGVSQENVVALASIRFMAQLMNFKTMVAFWARAPPQCGRV